MAELADATTSTPRTSLPIREVAISGRVALLSRLVADASVRHDIFFGNRPPIRKVIPLRSVPHLRHNLPNATPRQVHPALVTASCKGVLISELANL